MHLKPGVFLPYAEAAYGDPESSQTVVNVTNGKIIRLLVEDEPFDVRYGDLRSHERLLDLLLPHVSGRQFRAEQLRDPDLRAIPVILLSGEPGAAREAVELGAAACLGKPLELDALLQALWRHC